MQAQHIDALSATFSALADPTRRAILSRLSTGETSVTELALPFAMTMPAVTKHLKVLERAGLVTRSRTAQWRPCKFEAAPLRDATDWMAQYRHMWEARLDRLEDFLKQFQAAQAPPVPPSKTPMPTPARSASRAINPRRKK
jgi:DNA-binding transcriptional ArsR family regulator